MQVDQLSGLSPDSSAFRRRAAVTWLSDDPDTATLQTVAEMCRQIHQAALDPLVIQYARRAVQEFRGGPGWALSYSQDEARRAADSCWWWCKWNLKFKHHGSMFEAWSKDLGDPRTKLQLLIAPDVLVRMRRMEGDCAIYTMMLCALLEALRLPWQIVTLAVDPYQPQIFSHVCARSNGEPLDASHGEFPGWQVPAADISREWVFDANGVRLADSGSSAAGRFAGLHAYRGRRHGRRGMGDDEGDPYVPVDSSSGGSSYPPYDPYLEPGGTSVNLGPGYFGSHPDGGFTAPSQNSAQWASFASNLAKMGFTLAEINSIQPGTVVQANGSILRQNPGYSVPAGGGAIGAALGGSNLLLYAGLAVAAVVAFSMGGRGR